ncbi:hypothetical protein A6F49_15085 [Enteractinococcus helveticum]|uniref:isochorismate synthase n=2 Tax=Enteractinococcus helveticum TaxID=1837282 RepID=A0A1B7LVY1_9MICC|nr:hypothetical protein A6F49_15085 [Enteractinococcus helveticum]
MGLWQPRVGGKPGTLLPIMSFTAAAFQLSDAQLEQLPTQIIGQASSAFSRHHRGKFGFGERYRFCTRGPQRFATARNQWEELTAPEAPVLPNGLRASAPIAFAAFTFDARSDADSVVTVPKFVLDVDETSSWLHYIYDPAEPIGNPDAIFAVFLSELPTDAASVGEEPFTPIAAQMTEAAFQDSVRTAVKMLTTGALDKVVLARDELLHSAAGFHIPATMRSLAEHNPTAWTYKVANLIGSTPELLIARKNDAAKARVLAGTVDRTVATNDQLIAEQLSDSPKQIFEHQAAVDSLVEKLSPFATDMQVSKTPFVLALPNVYHLATDVSARLTASTSILDLVAEINPTAAVGGTPRDLALDAIWQLEAQAHGMDRGLYAGAVGWLDANGHGEFGIALRGSVIEDDHHVRVYAGGGIVEGSDPAEELAETHAKMRPMKHALRVRKMASGQDSVIIPEQA